MDKDPYKLGKTRDEKPKGFLAKKLSASIENQVDSIANVIEERSIWQRYGF